MALQARGMYKLIIRPFVEHKISQEGWQFLLKHTAPQQTNYPRKLSAIHFDGELICIQAMSSMDMENISRKLIEYGFRWSEDWIDCDFGWFEFNLPPLDWLEAKTARPQKEGLEAVEIWQMRNSVVNFFVSLDGRLFVRGEDYTW